MLRAPLGLRLAVIGCMQGRRGRAERGVESTLVSSPVNVPFPIPSPNPSPSPTLLFFLPFSYCAEVRRPTERPIVQSMEYSSSAPLAPSSIPHLCLYHRRICGVCGVS
jgi:hypothetical protein